MSASQTTRKLLTDESPPASGQALRHCSAAIHAGASWGLSPNVGRPTLTEIVRLRLLSESDQNSPRMARLGPKLAGIGQTHMKFGRHNEIAISVSAESGPAMNRIGQLRFGHGWPNVVIRANFERSGAIRAMFDPFAAGSACNHRSSSKHRPAPNLAESVAESGRIQLATRCISCAASHPHRPPGKYATRGDVSSGRLQQQGFCIERTWSKPAQT